MSEERGSDVVAGAGASGGRAGSTLSGLPDLMYVGEGTDGGPGTGATPLGEPAPLRRSA